MKGISKSMFFLFIGIICIFSTTVFANDKTQADQLGEKSSDNKKELKRKEQCISFIEERAAAIVARDWDNLERIAKDYLNSCREIHILSLFRLHMKTLL